MIGGARSSSINVKRHSSMWQQQQEPDPELEFVAQHGGSIEPELRWWTVEDDDGGDDHHLTGVDASNAKAAAAGATAAVKRLPWHARAPFNLFWLDQFLFCRNSRVPFWPYLLVLLLSLGTGWVYATVLLIVNPRPGGPMSYLYGAIPLLLAGMHLMIPDMMRERRNLTHWPSLVLTLIKIVASIVAGLLFGPISYSYISAGEATERTLQATGIILTAVGIADIAFWIVASAGSIRRLAQSHLLSKAFATDMIVYVTQTMPLINSLVALLTVIILAELFWFLSIPGPLSSLKGSLLGVAGLCSTGVFIFLLSASRFNTVGYLQRRYHVLRHLEEDEKKMGMYELPMFKMHILGFEMSPGKVLAAGGTLIGTLAVNYFSSIAAGPATD